MTNTGSIRGVSGEPLQVHRRTRLCLYAGGLTTSTDAYVIEGIRPQVILGLPWIQQKQPQVEWNDAGTLLFPNGGRWRAGECYTEKYSNSGQSYTKKYSRYNNVIPTEYAWYMHQRMKKDPQRSHITRQESHIPS